VAIDQTANDHHDGQWALGFQSRCHHDQESRGSSQLAASMAVINTVRKLHGASLEKRRPARCAHSFLKLLKTRQQLRH
jgi:hypothetical protein